MDDEAVGLIAWILIGLGGLVVALGAAGGIMYDADTTVGATVIEKQCAGGTFTSGSNSEVTVETRFPVPGIKHTLTEFSDSQCQILQSGKSYAEYSIRSGRTVLYSEEGGRCIYDSATGLGC